MRTDGPAHRPKTRRRIVMAGLLASCLAVAAGSQNRKDPTVGDRPDAEFQIARVMYVTNARAGSHGTINPMWAVDWPLAEEHFFAALRRYTRIDVAEDTRHLKLTDDRIFQYPFLWLQQAGYWNPSEIDLQRLREYLLRGGFLMIDDFHGEGEWENFQQYIQHSLPEFPIVDIPPNDPVMQIFFNLDEDIAQHTPILGDRHLRAGYNPGGPSHWRGIYDDKGRLMVIANHNMDIGDAWEHADDPAYPLPMTAFAYKLGTNYVLYAMTH